MPKARQYDQKSKSKLNGWRENTPNEHNIKWTTCLRLQIFSKQMTTHVKTYLKLSIHIYAHTDFYMMIGKYLS